MTELAEIARNLFASSLKTVDLHRSVSSQISISADSLVLAGSVVPLSEVDEVITIAVGKAAASMYSASEELFRPVHEIRRRGIVVAPAQHEMDWPNTQFFAGEHPIPGPVSANAARAALALLKTVTARSIVLFLISGGASAMLEQAIDPSISLQDLAAFYDALVTSGLSIARMNALRKHVSAVKGGRLAAACLRRPRIDPRLHRIRPDTSRQHDTRRLPADIGRTRPERAHPSKHPGVSPKPTLSGDPTRERRHLLPLPVANHPVERRPRGSSGHPRTCRRLPSRDRQPMR